MSRFHVEYIYHGGFDDADPSCPEISAMAYTPPDEDLVRVVIRATSKDVPHVQTKLFLDLKQAEQIADTLDEYLVSIGRRERFFKADMRCEPCGGFWLFDEHGIECPCCENDGVDASYIAAT